MKNIIQNVISAISAEPKTHFEIDGKQFVVHAYKDSIHAWAQDGSQSLFSADLKDGEKAEDFISIISDRIKEYLDGTIHCCDCGASFPIEEVNGYKRSYFAGVYCQHCWDTKWKAIEANETYD